jgi:hypothetical protein
MAQLYPTVAGTNIISWQQAEHTIWIRTALIW